MNIQKMRNQLQRVRDERCEWIYIPGPGKDAEVCMKPLNHLGRHNWPSLDVVADPLQRQLAVMASEIRQSDVYMHEILEKNGWVKND